MNSKASYENLTACIKNFRKNREKLISLIVDTKRLFNDICQFHDYEFIQCFDLNTLRNLLMDLGVTKEIDVTSHDNLNEVKLDIKNPAIVILGQVKAGKSTFINCLLQKNVVPQAFDRCTSRITRISFSKRKFLQIIDENGNVLKTKILKKSKIPKKYVKLDEKDCQNPMEVNKLIKVGVKVKFLECGIDIIDSPGIDGNSLLTNLLKCVVQNDMSLAVYVIDGRCSVKQTDVADLFELKRLLPDLQIFYFITHLDTDDPDECSTINDPIELSNNKMELAFHKLQYHNFISESFENWSDCPFFHGASLKCLINHSSGEKSQEIQYQYNQFCKFQSNLLENISIQFQNKILHSCDLLLNFHAIISAKIINFSRYFSTKTQENLEHITSIQKIEREMNLKIKHAITNSKPELIRRLIKRLNEESGSIIEPIRDTIYPSCLKIAKDGMVNDPVIISQCQISIMGSLIQSLENVLKTFVENELFDNYRNAVKTNGFHDFQDGINDSQSKNFQESPYQRILIKLLNVNYKLEMDSTFTSTENQGKVVEFMNVILSSIKIYLHDLLINKLEDKQIDVLSLDWKLKQAKMYLKRCDHHLLAEDVCRGLFEDFDAKHKEFEKAINSETLFLSKAILNSEMMRMKAVEQTPNLFMLFFKTLEIKGKYMFIDVQKFEEIGRGNQSKVYRSVVHGKEMAMKQITMSKIYPVEKIAEEIFYSHQFSHTNLLPTFGISLSNEGNELQIFSPLMKTNLRHYLKSNILNLEMMWKLSVQIAEALKCLHDLDIMHRDLKMTNILINEKNNAVLAEYGFCKSEALCKFSYIGTAIHIAPEIIKGDFYNKKIDIYAFGILLWHIFEGTGKLPEKATYFENFAQLVWNKCSLSSLIEMRPEKLTKIPDGVWQLMSKCWSLNPVDRPNIDDVIKDLLNTLQKSRTELLERRGTEIIINTL